MVHFSCPNITYPKQIDKIQMIFQHCNASSDTNLETVQIRSIIEQRNNNPSETLKAVTTKYLSEFAKHKWKISYEIGSDNAHNLEFVNKAYKHGTQQTIIFDEKLLTTPPTIHSIAQTFNAIHVSSHKPLFRQMNECQNGKHESNHDEYEVSNASISVMKTYKILFDILVSCYVRTMQCIINISTDKLERDQLEKDNRYYSLLNVHHFYNNRSNVTYQKHKESIDIVSELIEGMFGKYSGMYLFLKRNKELATATKTYIAKCCETCFHFGAYSLSQDSSYQYGLYPLCFVRDIENETIAKQLNEKNMNNELINSKIVRMANVKELTV